MIILRLLLLLTNLHLKLLSTQGTGADKLLSTQRVNVERVAVLTYDLVICKDSNDCLNYDQVELLQKNTNLNAILTMTICHM